MLKSRRFWIGLVVSLLFLFLFFYRVDFGDIGEALGSANYLYLIPAILLYFVAVIFRTLRWRYLLSPIGTFGVGRLFPVVVVGYMANNLLPVRLGELVRAYYIREREKVSASASLATIVVERVYDGLTLLFFIAVAAAFLPLVGVKGVGETSGVPWALLAAFLALSFLGAIVFLTLLAAFPRFRIVAHWLTLPLPRRLRPKAGELIDLFLQGLGALRSPRRQLGVFLLSIPVWLFEGAMYLVVGLSFGLPDFFSGLAFIIALMLLVTATANLAISLPSSQGGVGPFEFFAAATLILVGVSEGAAKAYALALHVALLVPVTLLGLAYLWWENLSLAQLARSGQAGGRPLPGYGKGGVVAQGSDKE